MGQRLVPFSLKSGHLIWFKCFHFGALDPTTQDLRLVCRLRRRPWVLFLSFFFIYLFFLRNKPYGWLPTNTNSDSFTKKQPSIPDHLPHRGCVLPLTENCAPPLDSLRKLFPILGLRCGKARPMILICEKLLTIFSLVFIMEIVKRKKWVTFNEKDSMTIFK